MVALNFLPATLIFGLFLTVTLQVNVLPSTLTVTLLVPFLRPVTVTWLALFLERAMFFLPLVTEKAAFAEAPITESLNVLPAAIFLDVALSLTKETGAGTSVVGCVAGATVVGCTCVEGCV